MSGRGRATMEAGPRSGARDVGVGSGAKARDMAIMEDEDKSRGAGVGAGPRMGTSVWGGSGRPGD